MNVKAGKIVLTIGGAESSKSFISVVVFGVIPSKVKPHVKKVAASIVASVWHKSRIYAFADDEQET